MTFRRPLYWQWVASSITKQDILIHHLKLIFLPPNKDNHFIPAFLWTRSMIAFKSTLLSWPWRVCHRIYSVILPRILRVPYNGPSSRTILYADCKLFSHQRMAGWWFSWALLVLRSLRTGKPASWLVSRVTSSFMHSTRQVSPETLLHYLWSARHFCLQFELRFLARFVAEFMIFSWLLGTAHWFLWNSLKLVCINISGKQTS